jgi:hypothetical protein
MKRSIALFFSLFYLLFSFGSLRAEASLLENTESQENIFAIKQTEESSANHFVESPALQKKATHTFDKTVLSEVRINSRTFLSQVPIFLRNCNFRR